MYYNNEEWCGKKVFRTKNCKTIELIVDRVKFLPQAYAIDFLFVLDVLADGVNYVENSFKICKINYRKSRGSCVCVCTALLHIPKHIILWYTKYFDFSPHRSDQSPYLPTHRNISQWKIQFLHNMTLKWLWNQFRILHMYRWDANVRMFSSNSNFANKYACLTATNVCHAHGIVLFSSRLYLEICESANFWTNFLLLVWYVWYSSIYIYINRCQTTARIHCSRVHSCLRSGCVTYVLWHLIDRHVLGDWRRHAAQ